MAVTTYQECDTRVFEGIGRTEVARAFVAALEAECPGSYPMTEHAKEVVVDLTEWPETKGFPATVTELFAKRGVKVLD